MKSFTAQDVVAFLNKLRGIDPVTMRNIVQMRTTCHPSFCSSSPVRCGLRYNKFPTLGILGLLNGLLDGSGNSIVAVFDPDGVLTHFELSEEIKDGIDETVGLTDRAPQCCQERSSGVARGAGIGHR